MTTIINYLTYDFSKYNDVFQILDYKQLLPLSQLVDYDMLFNEYNPAINSPTDLINYLNDKDPSILHDICSFLNSIPNNIQIRQSSAIKWQCPGAVTVINGKQKNIRLLSELNQINNKVKVLFLIARAYCHQNYCGQLIFNQYDLWDKYWGPSSHSLFPEQVDCKIDITFEHDTITIKDNNTYTYGYEHDYLIKIVRTDIKHKYFKSTSYIILKNKENIKLTSLINGIYEISIAVSYTNGINGINDYVWSEFCTSTVQPQIELTIPEHYLIIDNEVYWEYHFVLPADSNGNEGLPKYFDKYQGKMRNYFLTWWKETADGKLDNGSDTLGGASLENCSYDLRYTTEKPKKDSIWIYYNNIPFENENKKKSNYINPLFPSDDPPFRDPSVNPYQKITVLGYQNIWVQMRVRNQIGAPDWPITDGYPTGLPLNIYNEFGDELYGYKVETNTPPYFENVLATGDSNCEYPYTIGTFSWGAPADTMSPVRSLKALPELFKLNFIFTKPITWWATHTDDNTSDYQRDFKPNIKPIFLIFPLINTKNQEYTELDYTSKIDRQNKQKNYSDRPYFVFTNENFIQLPDDQIPQYGHLGSTNTAKPKNCYYNKLPAPTGFNFVDGRTYEFAENPCTTLNNNSNGYYRLNSDEFSKLFRPYLKESVINQTGSFHRLKYEYITGSNIGKITMDFLDVIISDSLPKSPIYIGMKVLYYNDLRITNHRYPYNETLTAIKIPPFNIEYPDSPSPEGHLQLMNTDVQYSTPIPISIQAPDVEVVVISYTYTENILAKTIIVTFTTPDTNIDLTDVKITVYTIGIAGNPFKEASVTSGPTKLTQFIKSNTIVLDNTNQDYSTYKSNIFFIQCKYNDLNVYKYYILKNTENTTFVIPNYMLNLSTADTFIDSSDPLKGDDYTQSYPIIDEFSFKKYFLIDNPAYESYYDSNKLHQFYVLDLHWKYFLLEVWSTPSSSANIQKNYSTYALKNITIDNLPIYDLYIQFLNDNILFDIPYLQNGGGHESFSVATGIKVGPSPYNSVYMNVICPPIPSIDTGSGGEIHAIRRLECSLYFSTDIFSGNNHSKVTTYTRLRTTTPPEPPLSPSYTKGKYPIPLPMPHV